MRLVQWPYAEEMLRHPLFGLDARRMRAAWQPQQFWRTSLRIMVIVQLIISGLWATLGLVSGGRTATDFNIYAITSANFIAVVSVLVNALLDFICVQGAVKTISGEITAGRWDLLRLTALSENGIVRAKHAGVRLRVWRATMIVASVRAATISLIMLGAVVVPLLFYGESPLLAGLIDGLIHDPISTVLALVVVTITAAVYCLEPFWRAQALTALGMVLSAYIQSVPVALLAGLGVIFAVWLVQAIIVVALVLGLGVGLGAVFSPLVFGNSALVVALYLLISCLITALTIYGFYSLVQTWGLRRVLRRIQTAD